MRTTRQLMAVTLLAAACATPAAANYFSNPMTNTMLNVGSAPSPTPEQLRLIGDSFAVETAPHVVIGLSDMVGKDVYGKNRELLGKIRTVNEMDRTAEMQLPTGVVVSLSADNLIDRNDRVIAPNMSRGDVIALADRQGLSTAPIE